MFPESEFDDVVLFEVPAAYADLLWAWLKPVRLTWLNRTDEEDLVVVAALSLEAEDLASLLRDAETWLSVSDLPYLRFVLDGREYMLRAQTEAPPADRARRTVP
jgi:hypothetical protein